MTLFSVLPEELDSVGGGVEPGRQGLGAVPSAHQLLAHHLSALPLQPAVLALPLSTNMMFLLMNNDQ